MKNHFNISQIHCFLKFFGSECPGAMAAMVPLPGLWLHHHQHPVRVRSERGTRCVLHAEPSPGFSAKLFTQFCREQDEAHEPECWHVCWERQTILITFSTGHRCGTPWHNTLMRQAGRTLLFDTLAQHSSNTLILETLIWHSDLRDTLTWHFCNTLLLDTLAGQFCKTLL